MFSLDAEADGAEVDGAEVNATETWQVQPDC